MSCSEGIIDEDVCILAKLRHVHRVSLDNNMIHFWKNHVHLQYVNPVYALAGLSKMLPFEHTCPFLRSTTF